MQNPRTKSNPTPLGAAPPRAGVHFHLPEEVIAEILSRLPGKSVLRFRAVSRSWHRITTDPHFLAAHARRRPLEIILCTVLERRPKAEYPGWYDRDLVFDSIPVAATDPADRRRLICYSNYVTETPFCVGTRVDREKFPRASCAGVLLFRKEHRRYSICNPVTRQWTELPRLPQGGSMYECGFYFHQSSGEYRLLCRLESHDSMAKYYITSTGAMETRNVSTGNVDDEVIQLVGHYDEYVTSVALQDRLHWMLQPLTGGRKIVTFDTLSEMFQHLMPAPLLSSKCVKLFDMNQMLAVANFGETHIDLWLLEDYNTKEWVHRHQIVTPPMLMNLGDPHYNGWSDFRCLTAASEDGEDIILGRADSLMVYNVRTKTTRGIDFIHESKHYTGPRHLFRESLLPHGTGPSAGHPMVKFSWVCHDGHYFMAWT